MALSLRQVSASIQWYSQKKWQEGWKDHFKPFFLTQRIEIIPAWQRKNFWPKRKQVIYLDNSLAFGTGLHETTRFMAQLIESCLGRFEIFFDIETGTGILSLVAFSAGTRVDSSH